MSVIKKLTMAAFLSGCVEQVQVETAPYSVTRLKGFQSAGLIEYERTTVRTYAGKSGKKTEVKGVPCTMTSKTYTVRFVTPAVVNVPDYGKSSPIPVVSCKYGEATRNVAATLYNRTEFNRQSAAMSGGGLLGVLVVEVAASARKNKPVDDYAFQPIEVRFDLNPPKTPPTPGVAVPVKPKPRTNECPLC